MKPDWDKLGAKYASSETVMIVDADCTGPAQGTCGSVGVKGYPTIKYFIDGKSKDYQGGRDFNSLSAFVASTLDKEKCDVATGKYCKPNEKKFIDEHKSKTVQELKVLLKEKEDKYKEVSAEKKAAEKEFREKQKGWKKQELLYKTSTNLIKGLQKIAGTTKSEL